MRLAIVTTHPIQYYAPLFKLLQLRLNLMVYYTWGEKSVNKYDPGFGKMIKWDTDLFEGYDYQWADNVAADAGSHHFKGIITPGLIGQIEAFSPDALLVFGWSYQSHLKSMRYFKGKVPVLFRGDSTLLDETSGPKAFLRLLLLSWIYRHVDHAFYVGANNKAYFKKYGLKEQQLTFAPHAIDNKRYEHDRKNEAVDLRQTLSIPVEDIVILFAGKFESKKDPMLLLNTFLKLNKPGVHLLLAGNGVLEQALKKMAVGYPSVHFIDFQNQQYMPVVYQACDLFCLPSKGPAETWGLAVNEAMACGKAVLVSDKVGCAADLVKPGENGAIFKTGDADDLLSKLSKLTKNRELLSKYGDNSKTIISQWTFEKTVINIENYLNETL